jgi:hypothetical protein
MPPFVALSLNAIINFIIYSPVFFPDYHQITGSQGKFLPYWPLFGHHASSFEWNHGILIEIDLLGEDKFYQGERMKTEMDIVPVLHVGTIQDLPAHSAGPTGSPEETADTVRRNGYEGIQFEESSELDSFGLRRFTLGRANTPGEILGAARKWRDAGFEAGTLHVGWGYESDAEIDRLCAAIISANSDLGFPLYLETHRATITEDPWRTVEMVRRNPDIRFNGDFSHWYTGSEMIYGDFDEKLDRLAPVFERVRFVHARVGNSCCMQVPLEDPSVAVPLTHFTEIWRRSFIGALDSGETKEVFFAPELLPPSINYARLRREESGAWQEEGDRWNDALRLVSIATKILEEINGSR